MTPAHAAWLPGIAAAGSGCGGSAAAVTGTDAAQMQAALDACTGNGGLVIRYAGSFDFSSITDTCEQWQKPDGAIVEIKNKSNIVIRNTTIGLLPGSIDAIGIEGQGGKFPGYVWIDHNTPFSSVTDCPGAGDLEFDGLIDNEAGAHHITYPYNHTHDHQKVALIGSSDSDASDRFITCHPNVDQSEKSRLPLQRGGHTHLYNNLYSDVLTSGANIRMGGCVLIEGNHFENAKNPMSSRDNPTIGDWELRNNNIPGAGRLRPLQHHLGRQFLVVFARRQRLDHDRHLPGHAALHLRGARSCLREAAAGRRRGSRQGAGAAELRLI